METIELELNKVEQDAIKMIGKMMNLPPQKALVRLVREVGEVMERDRSLSARRAVRIVMSRYIKA